MERDRDLKIYFFVQVSKLHFCHMREEENSKVQGEDYYLSEEGFFIFTEEYHLKRGHCCQSGCKHCPFGFDKKTGKFNR